MITDNHTLYPYNIFTLSQCDNGHDISDYKTMSEAHDNLYNDYFHQNPVYNEKTFRRRFRMRRELFYHICDEIVQFDSYFVQKSDACGRLGCSTIQKVTAALRVLAYDVSADSFDEYLKMSETVIMESIKRFCKAVILEFGKQYLRAPHQEDVDRLLAINSEKRFPGILGSIDCMH